MHSPRYNTALWFLLVVHGYYYCTLGGASVLIGICAVQLDQKGIMALFAVRLTNNKIFECLVFQRNGRLVINC